MEGKYWSSAGVTVPDAYKMPPGTTGVRFYSDPWCQTEIFPIAAHLSVPIDVAALRNGTLDISGKSVFVEFSSDVNIKSVKLLGNPVVSATLPYMHWGAFTQSNYTGAIGYYPVDQYNKTAGSVINQYNLADDGTVPDVTINWTVPAYPNMYGKPYVDCTGESVTGGIADATKTYQWYAWNGSAWITVAGGSVLDMPYVFGTTDVGGTNEYSNTTLGNKYKLVVTQNFTSGAVKTTERVWSVSEYLLHSYPINTTGALNTPITILHNTEGGNFSYGYSWSVTGGTPASGTGSVFSPSFSSYGTYTVTLVTTSGTQSTTRTSSVWINPPAITATLEAVPTTGLIDQNFVFTISGVSGGQNPGTYSYAWSGPDGLTGTGTSVSKVFSSTGTKTITCVITSGASTLTKTVNITITDAPITGTITVTPSPVTLGTAVTMTVNPSGGNGTYTYSWSGDETLTGTAVSITKTYSTIGTKNITCNVTSNGITTPITTTVVVESAPALTLSLSASHYIQLLNTDVVFTPTVNGGVGGYTYSWAGTDGKSGTGSTATFQWNTVGTKTVSLTVTSGTQNITKDVSVQIVTAFATNLGRLCFIS